jgi:hypothetical protein
VRTSKDNDRRARQETYAGSLAPYPPVGSKDLAVCYEDSTGAGNAQCTADCVPVTALNGTTFYPEVRVLSV